MIIKFKNGIFNVSLCNTYLSHLTGLMFKFPKNDGLLFIFKKEEFISLHMLFVFLIIDIIYLNEDKKVIKILKRAKPFTLFIKPIKCKYILELRSCKNLELNDKIQF